MDDRAKRSSAHSMLEGVAGSGLDVWRGKGKFEVCEDLIYVLEYSNIGIWIISHYGIYE